MSAFALASYCPVASPPPLDPAEQFRSLLDNIPSTVETLNHERPSLKHEISKSYKFLRQACPALSKIDIKSAWNLGNWMNRNITAEEWSESSYSFRMNSFRAVSVQRNSAVKTEMLGKLYKSIGFHPGFTVWADDGLSRLIPAMQADPLIRDARKNWKTVSKSDERLKAYVERIGDLTFSSFLPDVEVKRPEITIHRDNIGPRGYYNYATNSVGLNFSPDSQLNNSKDAEGTITHEYFHAIEIVLKNWALEGKLDDNPALNDAGDKIFYSFDYRLGQVSDTVDVEGYLHSFHERASNYIKSHVMERSLDNLASRKLDWDDILQSSRHGMNPSVGTLPKSCALR